MQQLLSAHLAVRRPLLVQAFIAAHGLADPEPFGDGDGVAIAANEVVSVLSALNVTDDFLHRNAIVHELAVANDQRNKAVRFVQSGHFDVNSLILRYVNSHQHGRLLLVSAGCLASRKSHVYGGPCVHSARRGGRH